LHTIPTASASLSPPAGAFDPPTEVWSRLDKLLHDRLRKCVALLPRVLSRDDPDAVHDLRVWSRRSQQLIVALFPQPRPREARVIMTALRRARHSLGGWRNCDVLIALLERKARRIRRADEKQAWEMIRDLARKKRRGRMRRARRKLANRKLLALVHRGQVLIERRVVPNGERDQDPLAAFVSSVAAAHANWREGLACARASLTTANLHAFRIKTKRLRYRVELARDLGSGTAQEALASLKAIQDQLGRWHDSVELVMLAADALADSEFLAQHPRTAAAVLRKIDRNSALQIERVRRLLEFTHEGLERSAIQAWIRAYCGRESVRSGGSVGGAVRGSEHDARPATAPEDVKALRV
jgi:CHAD domain-containing protein